MLILSICLALVCAALLYKNVQKSNLIKDKEQEKLSLIKEKKAFEDDMVRQIHLMINVLEDFASHLKEYYLPDLVFELKEFNGFESYELRANLGMNVQMDFSDLRHCQVLGHIVSDDLPFIEEIVSLLKKLKFYEYGPAQKQVAMYLQYVKGIELNCPPNLKEEYLKELEEHIEEDLLELTPEEVAQKVAQINTTALVNELKSVRYQNLTEFDQKVSDILKKEYGIDIFGSPSNEQLKRFVEQFSELHETLFRDFDGPFLEFMAFVKKHSGLKNIRFAFTKAGKLRAKFLKMFDNLVEDSETSANDKKELAFVLNFLDEVDLKEILRFLDADKKIFESKDED